MNEDRDLDLLMDQWLAGGPADPADRLKDEAMAKVVVTPQMRGPLLPGRFTKMTAIAGVAAAFILAASGAGLYLAVSDGDSAVDPAPAAAAELDPAEIVAQVSGDFAVNNREGPHEVIVTDYAYENRNAVETGTVAADDPRLEGELELIWNLDDFRPGLGGPMTMSIAVHIENGDGAWDGVLQGITYEQSMDEPGYLQGVLSGSGDYAGQSAYIVGDTNKAMRLPFHGLIFPGDMPEVP